MLSLSTLTEVPPALKLLAHEVRWQLVQALAYGDQRVQELVEQVGRPQNLVSYHLRQLARGGLVHEHRSAADGRDVYYVLDLERLNQDLRASAVSLHPALGGGGGSLPPPNPHAARVLFLCTHNSARSQMAEALLRHLSQGQVEAVSAGSAPAGIHPQAIQTMQARGLDMARQQSKHLDEFAGQPFGLIITVCDRVREVCPIFPSDPARIHWSLPDPAAVPEANQPAAFEATADILTTRIQQLLTWLAYQTQEIPCPHEC